MHSDASKINIRQIISHFWVTGNGTASKMADWQGCARAHLHLFPRDQCAVWRLACRCSGLRRMGCFPEQIPGTVMLHPGTSTHVKCFSDTHPSAAALGNVRRQISSTHVFARDVLQLFCLTLCCGKCVVCGDEVCIVIQTFYIFIL